MSKIILDVENKDKETILMILKNLNPNLIKRITVDNKPISIQNQKKRLNKATQKPLEDEFLPKPINSNNRYLSKEEFKNRLNKAK